MIFLCFHEFYKIIVITSFLYKFHNNNYNNVFSLHFLCFCCNFKNFHHSNNWRLLIINCFTQLTLVFCFFSSSSSSANICKPSYFHFFVVVVVVLVFFSKILPYFIVNFIGCLGVFLFVRCRRFQFYLK